MAADSKTMKRMNQYCDLMLECKVRLEIIHNLLSSPPPFPGIMVAEMCYLQLRMLCETIALGCLVVHGDVPTTQSARLRNAYEADKIVRELGMLHKDFYPTPSKMTSVNGRSNLTPNDPESGLSKEELQKLWQTCGGKLHRGKFKRLDTRQLIKQVRADEIAAWQRRIFHLLNQHVITCLGTKGAIYLVEMRGYDQAPQAAFLESAEPPAGFFE